MTKKSAALLLILVAIAIAGCTGGGQQAPDQRSGTRGLEISFVQGNPPDRFLAPGEMGISLQIKNLGWAKAEGNVYLSGFDQSILQNIRNPNGVNIPNDGLGLGGRSIGDPQGGIAFKDFKVTANLADDVDVYRTTILATACYDYNTIASAIVCVDPDPFTTAEKQKVCQTGPVSLGGGQGGPIAVTRIDPATASGKIRFTIHVQNAGGGIVYEQGKEASCSPYGPGLSFAELNQVNIEYVRLGNSNLDCQPGGQIKLIDGSRSFLCEYNIPGDQKNAFNSPIVIKLNYGYRDSTSRNLEIAKVPR